ncbi:MAG: phosphoribosyltransferase [Armatimonadota bacterium]|nr:phosphoribosyltransferase [Armatimonadota bacterium]
MSTRCIYEPFENRSEAGALLAKALEHYKGTDTLVMAIPRGGVVVGYEVATRLKLDLDVIVPRKIPAPGQEELAIGAVASWGNHDIIFDEHAVRFLGISEEYIRQQAEAQLAEVNRRLLAYRGTNQPPDVKNRNVILVDDGIATGYTTRAAIIALKRLQADRVVLAVPVGPPESVEALRPYVDELVCLRTPSPFLAVGYWYRDFRQTTDAEVIELLEKARSTPK